MITVTITMADDSLMVFEEVVKSEPRGSFFLVGLEDKTIVIPESQIKVISTTKETEQ